MAPSSHPGGPSLNAIGPLIQAAMAAAPKVAAAPLSKQQQQAPPPPPPPPPLPVTATRATGPQSQPQPQGVAPSQGVGLHHLRGQINQEDPIIQVDYSSINDEILNKRTANFVYFNANFNQCRNCQRFFSIWKELALDIRWWRNVVKLFTINCSDEDNIDVCRRAGVTEFPQLKFYWVMSNSLNQDGQRLRILGKSVHAMRHLIMDKVLDSYMEHNKLLGQRERQRASSPAVANPLGMLASLTGPPVGGSTASGNPLAAFMPMISQLMSPVGAAAPNSSLPNGGAGGGAGGLVSLMGMLGGQKPGAAGTNPSASLSITNLMSSMGGMQGISQMINALMSMTSWRRSLSLQPLPSNWPRLDTIEVTDTQALFNVLGHLAGVDTNTNNNNNKNNNNNNNNNNELAKRQQFGTLLIMETQEFMYTGLEVMLDLNPYNQTYIARVRDERSLLSKNLTKLDDVQAPGLIYVNEAREAKLIMTAPKYTNDEDLRRAFVRAFERRQIKYPVKRVFAASSAANSLSARPGANSSETDEESLSRMNDVYMNDLVNTIRSSLTDQVMRHPDLSDDQFNALIKYVYVLINYFPFNDDEQLKFFKRLHTWLQNQVSPVDIAEYKKQFHDVDEVLGKKRDWIACRSLSSVNSIPSRKKSGSLFENPSQFGKVVSNITRLFRANQQKVGQLKNLVGMFTSNLNSNPVMLTNNNNNNNNQQQSAASSTQQQQQQQQQQQLNKQKALGVQTSTTTPSPGSASGSPQSSSLEKLIKSLTSGSLGSDSSILKLISTALGGGTSDSSKPGKSKFAREYSCGTWKLAHVMVVNEYIRDSPRKDVKHIVLHSLYQYMLHFYACATCGNRVSDVSGEFRLNLDEHLGSDQGDSIMLLWKIHNRVNKRLESEIRPGSPNKLQFPSESLCPKCRASKRTGTDLVSTPNWHEKQVLNFLVHHYRPQSIILNADSSSTSSSSTSSSSSDSSSSRPVTRAPPFSLVLIISSLLTIHYGYWWWPGAKTLQQ